MSMGEAGFHLGFDSIKGRQLIAQRVYQVGELIFEEDPLVVSQFEWNKLYKYLACDYCLYPLESCEKNLRRLCQEPSIVLPHPECDVNANIEQRLVRCVKCQEIFCSMSCYEQAWNSYHATLCSFQENRLFKEILDLWRSAHPPPETTTISLVLKLMAMLKQNPNRSQLLGELQKFSQGVQSDNQKFFHKLLRKEFEPQVEQLRAALEQFNDQYMQIEEFRWFLTAHGFRQLLALLGRNQQGIGTSVLAMWVKQTETLPDSSSTASASSDLSQWIDAIYTKIDEVSGEFIDCEGSGLFRLQSCLNHSCDANAEIQYRHHNSRLSVVTTKMIAANEEITINYLSECDRNRSRHSRRKILRENYLFDCQCARCALESNEADVTSDEEEEEMDDD